MHRTMLIPVNVPQIWSKCCICFLSRHRCALQLSRSHSVSDQFVCLKWHFIRSTELEFLESPEFLGRPVRVLKPGCASPVSTDPTHQKRRVGSLRQNLNTSQCVRAQRNPSHSGHCEVLVFNARFRGRAALLLFSRSD